MMTLWIVFGVLTIVTLLAVLRPFWWSSKAATDDLTGFDVEVYRDQLNELERDGERGLINDAEKAAAHNEISRRLLAATAKAEKAANESQISKKTSNAIAGLTAIGVLGLSGYIYSQMGQPNLPDVPQQQRIENAAKNQDMPALILKVQQFLQKNPNDIRGWKVLAPALKRMKKYDEAAKAYARIMQLEKPTPTLLTDYAESLLLGNKGELTERVKVALQTAMKMDPKFTKAGFYWAAALQQDGQYDESLKVWRQLMTDNPKDIKLQMFAQRQIAAIKNQKGKMPALDKDQRQAAANMTAKDRQEMIRSMVDRLAGKLKENGKDLDGWLRLIRARMVLGDKKAALGALEQARSNFTDDQAALAKLKEVQEQLNKAK